MFDGIFTWVEDTYLSEKNMIDRLVRGFGSTRFYEYESYEEAKIFFPILKEKINSKLPKGAYLSTDSEIGSIEGYGHSIHDSYYWYTWFRQTLDEVIQEILENPHMYFSQINNKA